MNTSLRHTCSLRSLVLTAVLLTTSVGCAADKPSEVPAVAARLTVILDYSPTLSDAGALLYLASNPLVDLLAVTLPGTGEADCETGTRVTRSLLTIAGRVDVPVGCGRSTPLIGDHAWPEAWRTVAASWGPDILPEVAPEPVRDAEQLLTETIGSAAAPVTIVAVAPLTNLGVVLVEHADLVDRIERIVVMGGAVRVPGNVEAAPAAEWNWYIDPEADRRVMASGVSLRMVPLDATNDVPWTDDLLARLGTLARPTALAMHQIAAAADSTGQLAGVYLWDELAAMTAVRPTLVKIEKMTVAVDTDGATVVDPAGAAVDVAVGGAAGAAVDEFLRVLNGGTLPPIVPLTKPELAYMSAQTYSALHRGPVPCSTGDG